MGQKQPRKCDFYGNSYFKTETKSFSCINSPAKNFLKVSIYKQQVETENCSAEITAGQIQQTETLPASLHYCCTIQLEMVF